MSLMTDFKFALRSLTRASGLALTVIVTLALGIGVTTAVFSVYNALLLRPLPFRHPDGLVMAYGVGRITLRGRPGR